MRRLPELGFRARRADGRRFYAFCDVSKLTNDSMAFARRMLAEAHVAATPGRDFDPLAGHRYMRFSYAGSHDDMVAGDGSDRALAAIAEPVWPGFVQPANQKRPAPP